MSSFRNDWIVTCWDWWVNTQVVKSKAAYAQEKRTDWIRRWPGQLVLGVSQVYWTRDVAETIRKSGDRGLLKHAKACTEELMETVTLVRGTLTKLERATIGALVVIDVHARDVVQVGGHRPLGTGGQGDDVN